MKAALTRWSAMLQDRLRYSRAGQILLGMIRFAQGCWRPSSPAGLARLAAAHRILLPAGGEKLTLPFLRKAIARPGNPWREHQIGWSRYRRNTRDGFTAVSHGLIVKPRISDHEKGILVIWVEYNLAALLRSPELRQILRDYRIVFSTSWSPPDLGLIWALSQEPEAELFVIPSNPKDEEWLTQIPVSVTVLPFYASHWIAEADYASEGLPDSEKKWDFSMIANWAPFKRHWLLFRALARMPDDIRVALVGQPQDQHTLESTRNLAAAFGVPQQIDWFNRLPPEEVRDIQARSRVGLLFSLREGACLAVIESLLSNVPVGMLEKAHVGSRDFINADTGLLLRESDLTEDLTTLLGAAKRGQFSPRAWALGHAEASRSSARLNAILKEASESRGDPWTRDSLPFCLRAARPNFIDEAHWIEARDWHTDFEQRYAIRFLQKP